MNDTTRSLPVQLAELIKLAQSAATGPALDQLREAYRLALQLGEELAMALVTVDRSRAAIGSEKHRADIYRGRVLELQGQADQAQAVRDAAADRIADLADERDALVAQLRRVEGERDAAVARLDAARTALSS